MSLVKFDRIISVSSEDPAFPADNLLKSNYSDKKWKCKQPGEKQISVVLQLDSSQIINAIDIGNYGSAFIEIFVGKSSNPDDFKVLVVASSLMTLQEAKLGENMSNVRFFKEECLSNPTALEKWDRIKLVCSQPYNKFIQYGLSFVVVHSKNSNEENHTVSTLGKFVLKPKEETDAISTGSLFAKRKETPNVELKGAAAIRAASTSGIINKKKPSKLLGLYVSSNQEELENESPGKIYETKTSTSDNNSVLRKTSSKNPEREKPSKPKEGLFNGSQTQSTFPAHNGQPPKKTNDKKDKSDKKNINKKRIEKPFNHLMEGVIFAISGFQNPYRSDLRSKAIAMGAKYKPDWDNSCTHLLCAFPNTPKFNQVLGHGKIVTKEWIENCYSRRMRLPWRRYALHPPDKNLPESEEEIHEYVPRPASPIDNRRRLSPGLSSGEDTEEEIERVLLLQSKKQKETTQDSVPVTSDHSNSREAGANGFNKYDSLKLTKKPAESETNVKEPTDSVSSTSPKKTKVFKKNKLKELGDECISPEKKKKGVMGKDLPISKEKKQNISQAMDEEECPLPNTDCEPGPRHKFFDPATIYEVDTDIEPETAESNVYKLPRLREFYDGIQFFVGQDLSSEERKKVERYITAHKGLLLPNPGRGLEFVVSRSPLELKELKKISPIAIGVKPDWIWICHDYNCLVAPSKFKIN